MNALEIAQQNTQKELHALNAQAKASIDIMERMVVGRDETIAAMQARVAELEAALEPFACMYDEFPVSWSASVEHETIYAMNGSALKYADFLRAADALKAGADHE